MQVGTQSWAEEVQDLPPGLPSGPSAEAAQNQAMTLNFLVTLDDAFENHAAPSLQQDRLGAPPACQEWVPDDADQGLQAKHPGHLGGPHEASSSEPTAPAAARPAPVQQVKLLKATFCMITLPFCGQFWASLQA